MIELNLVMGEIDIYLKNIHNCTIPTKKKYFHKAVRLIKTYSLFDYYEIHEDAYYWNDRIVKKNGSIKSKTIKITKDMFGYCAYIMSCQDENNRPMLKVGYTADIYSRRSDLNNKSQIGNNYQVLKLFNFNNAEDGYEMEIWLHRYCKALGGGLRGNDHFYNLDYNNFDLDFLDKTAEKISKRSTKWLDKIK